MMAHRYFDVSTLLVLGLAAFLLVSLPGGCLSDDGDGEAAESDTEAVASPTAPPTMEIVEPEPGDIDSADVPDEEDGSGEGDSDDQEPPQDEPSTTEDGRYVVQEGDTLYAIAVDFGVTMEDLMAVNEIEDPNQLQVGQELTIP